MAELSPLAAFDLLHRMMQRLGIDADKATHQAVLMTDAQWHCRLGKSWRECRHWLDSGADDAHYREFCANVDLLDRLREALARQPLPRQP